MAQSEGRGTGSTFRVRLPLTTKPLPAKVPAPHFSFQGRKLLLVEDNEDARTMLAKTLRLSGFVVAEAPDGQSALEHFRTFQPDVAVIDIGLPEMDGYQLAREIRQLPQADGRLLVALTGYGRDEDREAAREAGFDAHLVKPLNPAELFRQVAMRFTSQEPA